MMKSSLTSLFIAVLVCSLAGCAGTARAPMRQAEVAGAENFDALKRAEDTYHAGNYADAQALFNTLAQRYPRNPYIWLRLGNTCAKLQRYDDAAAAYERALAEDKQYVQASYNLGLVRLAQSEQAFEYARATAPEGSLTSREVDEVFQYSRRLMVLLSNGQAHERTDPPAAGAAGEAASLPVKESVQ